MRVALARSLRSSAVLANNKILWICEGRPASWGLGPAQVWGRNSLVSRVQQDPATAHQVASCQPSGQALGGQN